MKALMRPRWQHLRWVVTPRSREDSASLAPGFVARVPTGLEMRFRPRGSYSKSWNTLKSDRKMKKQNKKRVDWQVQGAGHMQMKHLNVFGPPQAEKQRDLGPRLFSEDAARTHIPACFRSSTQAQSQGFPPFSRWKKGLQYHLLQGEGGPGWVEGLLSLSAGNISWLWFQGKSASRSLWLPGLGRAENLSGLAGPIQPGGNWVPSL